ncbi:hypothetical protein CICLE_v10018392mg [Citrus x clementina]|uniref:Uncharacterized protein n=1 Tax=Citrus clementina TaxID=85681 RepID=V4U4H7_CITCL|nr:hypothetical protein CICLE_v10018392mg [Citrus x clementina]
MPSHQLQPSQPPFLYRRDQEPFLSLLSFGKSMKILQRSKSINYLSVRRCCCSSWSLLPLLCRHVKLQTF